MVWRQQIFSNLSIKHSTSQVQAFADVSPSPTYLKKEAQHGQVILEDSRRLQSAIRVQAENLKF